jgi:hypothetical protein
MFFQQIGNIRNLLHLFIITLDIDIGHYHDLSQVCIERLSQINLASAGPSADAIIRVISVISC